MACEEGYPDGYNHGYDDGKHAVKERLELWLERLEKPLTKEVLIEEIDNIL